MLDNLTNNVEQFLLVIKQGKQVKNKTALQSDIKLDKQIKKQVQLQLETKLDNFKEVFQLQLETKLD
ncbi:hypothetical protein EBX93_17215 [bacterium]|nr:hypothetical protein [bacterium]